LATALVIAVLVLGARAPSSDGQSAEGSARAPVHLRVEYQSEPLGVDTPAPRFSWELDDPRRGALQTAYRVIVSQNKDILAQGKGDEWDSGQVPLADTNQVAYAGRPLTPWRTYWWLVRAWDQEGKPSPWSVPASFTVGPLVESDWRAQWITAAVAKPATSDGDTKKEGETKAPVLGYHSTWSPNADDFKYVQIDFGQPRIFDSITIHPARPGGDPKEKGVLYPLRFKIWVDDTGRFDQLALRADQYIWQDIPDAGAEPMTFKFPRYKFRYVRLVIEKMQKDGDKGYAFALGEIELKEGDHNIAPEGKASAGDSLEEGGWTVKALNDNELVPRSGPKKELLPPAQLRKDFFLGAVPKRALLAASALGTYDITINGAPALADRIAPGWTDYKKRVPYQVIDVTALLQQGDNTIGVQLADGWYAGRIGAVEKAKRGSYDDTPQFRAHLQVDAGGKTTVVGTDTTWKWARSGPIRSSDLLDGENYDSHIEARGWNYPKFIDEDWRPVVIGKNAPALFAQVAEPVRTGQEIAAVAVTNPSPDRFVYDFGQNIAGIVRLRPPPTQEFPTLVMRHAEALDDKGNLWTDNLGTAAQTDTIVLRPGMPAEWEPRFTFHGFRYVEITGAKPPLTSLQVSAVPFTSAVRDVGSFECSDPMLTQLWKNIVWTRRNDFLGMPLDAPQRDTRVAELGALLPFLPTALLQADLASFLTQWLADVRGAQAPDGRFPDFAPHPLQPGLASGTPGWADAGVFVPWEMYLHYHDQRLLAASLPSMLRWIEFVRAKNPDLVWKEARGSDLGDRFNGNTVDAPGWKAEGGEVPHDVFATAFFARSCEIAAKAAYALQKTNDADRLEKLRADACAAFRHAFVEENGRIQGDTQAGYALALDFGLFAGDARLEDLAVSHLVRKIDEAHGALTTGMHTSHRVLLALSRHGRHDLALKIAQRRECPSWGNQIDSGATTTWERWDGAIKGHMPKDAAHDSLDSVAFGSIGEWMMSTIAGIELVDEHATSGPIQLVPILDGPTRSSAEGPRAFSHVLLKPMIDGNVTWARAHHASIAGWLSVTWRVEAGVMTYDCTIPANTTATLELPAKVKESVTEGGEPATKVKGLDVRRFENGRIIIDLPAGTYHFTSHV
jgi:alpha-L-rhamnosidase